ncbi:hypothetical protein J2I47_04965 [Fibrella sp. HMF5335]|uniref:Uncharacterized protein n=1 Tax=Fibrella rubiginis TaxID=2817060 RepID=A0A939GBB6_9BACT|nr:hypothetical protein [Fibrella rubiginis]MBO0935892.1 hypothetical protein [Fibrella rubiginis]
MPSPTPSAILQQLTDDQLTNRPFFADGLFPAYRYNQYWRYQRPDPNLFFTAISVFTLQQLLPHLAPAEQERASALIARAQAAYALFRNKDGLPTYNFYGTSPSRHFPYGWLMHRFRHFQLPDDIDDTAMVYLTRGGGLVQPSASDLTFLHEKLAQHANGTRLTVKNTFPEYRSLRAYSTWFGKNMPIEFDACALANMLCCVYAYGLPLDKHALDSLTLLADLIRTNRYRTDPFRAAHNYARPALIAYHIARLMADHDPELLRPVQAKFVADMQSELARTAPPMEQILWATSLLRLGETAPDVPLEGIEASFGRFSFFIAGMLSAYEQPWLYRWAHHPFWHIRWRCDAHCRVLVLEYLVLRNKK